MRQLVIGIVAAAALVSSGVAQARPSENRPGDRPGDFGGGRAGSVVAASNPYRNTEGQAIARAQQRVMQKTNFHASRPSDTSGADTDRASRTMKATSSHGGGGMPGSVKSGLNVYRTTEIMGIQAAMKRALQKTNQHASMPADSDGADADKASKMMKTQFTSGGGHGMAGSVKSGLNVYRTAEIMGVQNGMKRALQKTNQHAAMPADSDGADADKASKQMKAEYVSRGGGGSSGAIRYGLNPYFRNEHTAIANGMKRAQSKAGADAPMPKGLGGDTLHPNGTMSFSGHRTVVSSVDLRNERTINGRADVRR
ncbi:MAG TPA: hypothetical protein VGK67_13735 [Myxococcales bacterium]|jgi:hypothetical protein